MSERIIKISVAVLEITFIFFIFHLLYFNTHDEIHGDLHTDILSVNLSNCALKVSISTLFQYLVNRYFNIKHIFPQISLLQASALKSAERNGNPLTDCHGSNLPKILWPKFHIYLDTMIWIKFHSSLKNELFVNYIRNYTGNRIIRKHSLTVFRV